MVTNKERKFIKFMVWIKAFYGYDHMRCLQIGAVWGFLWILNLIEKRQIVDDFHHAPCCPSNHWHKKRLVFQDCTCGADR